MRAWMHPMLLMLIVAANASAEVLQSLEVKTYNAPYRAETSLRSTISAASPIRHEGKVYHGFTRWHVNWQLWWRPTPDGRCAIYKTQTRVTGIVTLPSLTGAPAEVRQTFDAYVSALRHHEMGHFQFGLNAAEGIDRQILSLPPHASCSLLEAAANRVGHRILNEAIQAEIDYDRRTRHGQTQGVTLAP